MDEQEKTGGSELEKISEEARKKLDVADAEFQARLDALAERSAKAKERMENQRYLENERLKSDRKAARGLGIGLTVAYAIIGTPLVGFGGGWLLDRSLGTTHWQSVLGLIGSFGGVAYAVWILNKMQDKMD